ncbi:MAG: hypothetical protein ACXIUW_15630 [Roseinatronobacter sp.]
MSGSLEFDCSGLTCEHEDAAISVSGLGFEVYSAAGGGSGCTRQL